MPLGQAQGSCRPGGLCCVCLSGGRYRENLGESLTGEGGLMGAGGPRLALPGQVYVPTATHHMAPSTQPSLPYIPAS